MAFSGQVIYFVLSRSLFAHCVTFRSFCVTYGLSSWETGFFRCMCAQRRLRSDCASAQSDQSLRCPIQETWAPLPCKKRPAKTLIRLRGCAGWSESSLGARFRRYIFIWSSKLENNEPGHEKKGLTSEDLDQSPYSLPEQLQIVWRNIKCSGEQRRMTHISQTTCARAILNCLAGSIMYCQ